MCFLVPCNPLMVLCHATLWRPYYSTFNPFHVKSMWMSSSSFVYMYAHATSSKLYVIQVFKSINLLFSNDSPYFATYMPSVLQGLYGELATFIGKQLNAWDLFNPKKYDESTNGSPSLCRFTVVEGSVEDFFYLFFKVCFCMFFMPWAFDKRVVLCREIIELVQVETIRLDFLQWFWVFLSTLGFPLVVVIISFLPWLYPCCEIPENEGLTPWKCSKSWIGSTCMDIMRQYW